MHTIKATRATAEPLGSIHFQGRVLKIVRWQGIAYTDAAPLSDLCGLDWDTVRSSITWEDNVIFYGTAMLRPPEARDARLHLRLDRVAIFLARINQTPPFGGGRTRFPLVEMLELQETWKAAITGQTHMRHVMDEARAALSLFTTQGG